MKKYCCRKFKRLDKKYGGIILVVDNEQTGAQYKEFREIWDLKCCIFCGKDIKERELLLKHIEEHKKHVEEAGK